jgi:hypothetical protein
MNTKATSSHSQYNTCAHKIGPEKKWCTFQVSALIRNGVPTVTTVNERHSCLVNLAEYSKEARFTMQEKVKKLKKKFKEKENERASAVKKRTIAARQGIDLGDEEEEEAFPSKTEIATEVKALLKVRFSFFFSLCLLSFVTPCRMLKHLLPLAWTYFCFFFRRIVQHHTRSLHSHSRSRSTRRFWSLSSIQISLSTSSSISLF